MFYLQDGLRIRDLTCAYLPAAETNGRLEEVLRGLREAQALVTYLYTSPHWGGSPFLPTENSTLFLFWPSMVAGGVSQAQSGHRTEWVGQSPGPFGIVDGYLGARNWHVQLAVNDATRLYPELPRVTLNLYQDLARDLGQLLSQPPNWAYWDFWFAPQPAGSEEVRRRVQLALEWYARSCRENVAPGERFATLATALESLLKVPEGKDLTQRFMQAVSTLLGPVDRLDWWLEQFYEARCKTVHEGEPNSLVFYPVSKSDLNRLNKGKQPPTPLGPLLAYGHYVFRLCLRAIVSAAVSVSRTGLAELFVPNQERVEAICRTLDQAGRTPEERLRGIQPVVAELQRIGERVDFTREAELDAVLGAVRRVLRAYKDTSPNLSEPVRSLLDQATGSASVSEYERMEQLRELSAALAVVGHDSTQSSTAEMTEVVRAFLEYATQQRFGMAAALTSWPLGQA